MSQRHRYERDLDVEIAVDSGLTRTEYECEQEEGPPHITSAIGAHSRTLGDRPQVHQDRDAGHHEHTFPGVFGGREE